MVGPVDDASRAAFVRRAKLALVFLVGVSGGLVAVQGDASPTGVAGATAAGLIVGIVVVRLVFPRGGWGPRRDA